MPARSKHRDAIVNAAAVLFRRNGYTATGLNEIVEVSGAPKGSLYHYFPKGKEQIAEAALRFAGARVTATFDNLYETHSSASALIRAYGDLLAGWMEQSAFRDGCPIATTLLEAAPASMGITRAGCEIFAGWGTVISRALVRDGFAKIDVRRLASLTIAAFEGALILARVERSDGPIRDVAQALATTVRKNQPARKSSVRSKRTGVRDAGRREPLR